MGEEYSADYGQWNGEIRASQQQPRGGANDEENPKPDSQRKASPQGFPSLANILSSDPDLQVFRRFDRDGSGTIDSSELQSALTQFGFKLPHNLLGLLVAKYGMSALLDP